MRLSEILWNSMNINEHILKSMKYNAHQWKQNIENPFIFLKSCKKTWLRPFGSERIRWKLSPFIGNWSLCGGNWAHSAGTEPNRPPNGLLTTFWISPNALWDHCGKLSPFGGKCCNVHTGRTKMHEPIRRKTEPRRTCLKWARRMASVRKRWVEGRSGSGCVP